MGSKSHQTAQFARENPELFIVHRLDTNTTGAVALARSKRAADEVSPSSFAAAWWDETYPRAGFEHERAKVAGEVSVRLRAAERQ